MNVMRHARGFALTVLVGALPAFVGALPAGATQGDAEPAAAAPPSSGPPRLTLPQLIAKVREVYPGIQAGRYSLDVAQAQLLEARMAFVPQGTIEGLAAPAPRIDCGLPGDLAQALGVGPDDPRLKDPTWRAQHCLTTPSMPTPRLVGISGIFLRGEINLAWPVYTFGKLSAALDAAHAAVSAGEGRVAQARAQVELELRRAYYGLKLARELKATVDEGRGHLESALKQTQRELEEGKGSTTVTDLRRLQVLVAEVDARRLEILRGEALALAGLRALVPVGVPRDFDVDEEALDRPETARDTPETWDSARRRRPELRLLDAAVAVRRASLDLVSASFYPDLLLVGRLSYAYTSSADTPQNSFYSNPLNGMGFGGGLAFRLTWDYGLKIARLRRARAELGETLALREQALGGIRLEIEKARLDLEEAQTRVDTLRRGEKAAQAWLNTVAQNFALGLAETRDFSDSLMAFFQMRLRWLQSLYDAQIAHASLLRAVGRE
jgi:outer membrane protein TolC